MVNKLTNTATTVCTLFKGDVACFEALSSEGHKVVLPKWFTGH